MSAVVNQPLLKTVANGKTLSDFALSRMMVKKKRARRALLSAAETRERTRSPDRRLGLQVSCQVSRRIYRTQPTRIGSPVMSRLPQGCATFTRLVFILDLGGRGYEPGGERASSARAVRDARWKKKSFFGRFFAQARPTKQQPRGLSS